MYKSGAEMPPILSSLLEYALQSLDIGSIMRSRLSLENDRIIVKDRWGKVVGSNLLGSGRTKVVAFGKASQSMMKSLLNILGDRVDEGILIYPKDQKASVEDERVKLLSSSHPVPDELSLEAARSIRKFLSDLSPRDSVIFLVSGGGSSLVEEPVPPITLEELKQAYTLLLNSGANIREVNTVRKHISTVKGGKLAQLAYPAQVISFIASDVPGNDISFVASGPTAPDPTTYQDALNIIEFYGLSEKMPESVMRVLKRGLNGELPETPKPEDQIFEKVSNYLIASPHDLAMSVKEKAEEMGLNAYLLTTRLEGESSEAAKVLSSIALDLKKGYTSFSRPAVLILAGETSVKVRGRGVGGRALELTAWFAREISESDGISMFAIDTDGKDGSSDAAGAFADEETWNRLKRLFGGELLNLLRNNDAYSLLDAGGYTIKTGPTGSNLNNLICIVVE